ncbi:type II toxin-antitoxin system PemK/MazF family toxin [Geothermobacter hydrogeniphilus]|uniref:mRNA interferase MazF n=1 Tax=Geothermobacter hydrogeniphilus TaxID=1969733 RepID=A0A1X0XSM0_9BACT|nr:type II toxin-antitoxin system PemK/MazF family toxin [Geothermobacter hydrogeniphilus]ORJ55874.1 hypothetical protein B5V00_14860 [Geothermobacter hydrogeniphilus]
MALKFHPKPGTVLICDFTAGFKMPEMIKRRPVVVVSPRPRRKTQLCIVVPLSTTCPEPVEAYHHRLMPGSLPGNLAGKETWAKCDMPATVSLARLDRVRVKREDGQRVYVAEKILPKDFMEIQKGVLFALGLGRLTDHLK